MKLAIITGGSKGLGGELVRCYHEAGWQVLEFSRSGNGSHHVGVDLFDLDHALPVMGSHLEILAGTAWEKVVMINNAAMVAPMAPLHQLEDAEIAHSITLNYGAGIRVMALFMRIFQHVQCPRILVNITSGAAVKTYAGWSLYGSAKAGLEAFVRTVAVEQAALPDGIVCINFNPGVMDTGMQEHIRNTPSSRFPAVQRFIDLRGNGLKPASSVAQTLLRLTQGEPENGRLYHTEELA